MTREYISRDEMIEQTKARVVLGAPKFNTGLETAIEVATSLPAADVVPVVRCKDCAYCAENAFEESDEAYCSEHDWCVSETYFCGDGKRKDGGQDDDYETRSAD